MSDRFVIEDDRQVIGVAVRVPEGFRFFASDPHFVPLEAKTFRRVRSMAQRVAQLGRRRPRRPARQPGLPAE